MMRALWLTVLMACACSQDTTQLAKPAKVPGCAGIELSACGYWESISHRPWVDSIGILCCKVF